jgi:hypothetical protein
MKRRGLTFGPKRADKSAMGSSWESGSAPSSAPRPREDGQALVEFALIAPLFLLIVVGIIQFGIGLNYWLDLNRIANQGARWAVVNRYPGCTSGAVPCNPSLQDYLESEPVSGGLNPDAFICFPENTDAVGRPVSVRMTTSFTFLPIMDLGTITLRAKATMRIEQRRTRYVADGAPPC